jgi:diguanylate cyclase (GGDEF)-like protein
MRSPAAVAERIRAGFAAARTATERGVAETTLSAGVAISGVDGEPFEALLKRADDALYAAKSAGRNRVHAPAPRLVA